MARHSEQPKEESFNFRVPADLKAAFQKATEKADRPAGQVIRDFMRSYVNEHQEPETDHDEWFRIKVQEALDNALPSKSHNEVMKQVQLLIEKINKNNNEH